MTETAPETASPHSTTPLALLVALGLGAVAALLVVTLAFSTSNTPHSIDGTKATYSRFLD